MPRELAELRDFVLQRRRHGDSSGLHHVHNVFGDLLGIFLLNQLRKYVFE
jgi:hypothetical protein